MEHAGEVQPSVSSLALLTCGVKSGSWAYMVLEAAFLDMSLLFVISCVYITYFDESHPHFSLLSSLSCQPLSLIKMACMSMGERYLLVSGHLDSGYITEESDSPSPVPSFYLLFLFQRDTALFG